jgi:hypothetical protein
MAFLVHTLLQFSSAYVHAVYQSPDQQFGLVRDVARGGFAYFTRAFANGTKGKTKHELQRTVKWG